MKISKQLFLPLVTIVALISLSFVSISPTYAANLMEESTVDGTISTVNPDGTVTVIDEVGNEFILPLPEGTDPASLVPGTRVELNVIVNEDGSTTVISFAIDDRQSGYFCSQSVDLHPAGNKIAVQMGVDYSTVQSMFCNDYLGWGEIKNLLNASVKFGIDSAELLALRQSGLGWGQIKHTLDISTANSKDKQTGKPENPGNGNKSEKPTKPSNPNKPN